MMSVLAARAQRPQLFPHSLVGDTVGRGGYLCYKNTDIRAGTGREHFRLLVSYR